MLILCLGALAAEQIFLGTAEQLAHAGNCTTGRVNRVGHQVIQAVIDADTRLPGRFS